MADKKTILDFIRHFKDAEFTFLNGCCYWFCYILTARFGGITLYEPVEGHFIQKIGDAFYDVRGEVTDKYINNEKAVMLGILRICGFPALQSYRKRLHYERET